MHYEDSVITIVDSNKKPIRELESEKIDKGRKCKLFLPFDTEYQFYIKNNSDKRIKLDIEIDGSVVTNDGFIVYAYQNCYLERFLNVDKKFKFVKANNENVSDPSNVENGIIKVRVYKEKSLPIPEKLTEIHHHHHYDNIWNRVYGLPRNDTWYITNPTTQLNYSTNIGGVLTSSNSPQSVLYSANLSDVGATIEGSKSNQTFNETIWNGDNGVETYFTFILKGITSSDKEQKIKEFLKLKEELGL